MTYIDPRAKVFGHLDRLVDWRRGEKPAPVTVEWDLSNRCTLGCQACHFAHTHTRGPWAVQPRTLPMAYASTGDMVDVELVTRGLGELAAAGVRSVVWSGGGEPTTHPHWQFIVRHAATLGLEQGMYTLGGLLTASSAAILAELLAWVVVSLDCVDGDAYAREKGVPAARFDAACEGIRALAGGSAVVGVSFLLHADNWRQAPAMLALGRSLGTSYVTFRPAIHTSPDRPGVATDDRAWITTARTMFAELARNVDVEIDPDRFEAYRAWRGHGYATCQGPTLNTTITPDGRVWICPQRRGVEGSCLGDLRVESFETLWARHPGAWTVDEGCRVLCRLHPVNEELEALRAPRVHGAFV